MRRLGIAVLWAVLSLAACADGRRPTSPTSNNRRCTEGSIRCSGTTLEHCNAAGTYVTTSRCADSGQICGTLTGTIVGCVDDRCSTGTTGGRCNDGSACTAPADCASGGCSPGGHCVSATCGNGRQDGAESGVDCGGPCPACFGSACSANSQCVSNYCHRGSCDEPSCTDQETNGTETGPDCGGARCPPCATGLACQVPTDCVSARCVNSRCAEVAASCRDNSKNGNETDTDCGGTDCGACALGKDCRQDRDCISTWCNLGRCDRATCGDGILNQQETAIDCGGPNCPACADHKACQMPADCASGRCENQTCTSCQDGVQNGSETGVDCGGVCGACDDGHQCSSPSACSSGRCEGGLCRSCADRVQSGAEVGVDCGGPCGGCPDNTRCSRSQDCAGGLCENSTCCTPNACGHCGPTPFETCNGLDDDCNQSVDDVGAGPLCPEQRGACQGATSRCGGFSGWQCDAAAYSANNAAYGAVDVPCDGIDNNCNGSVDEIACPTDNTVCTADSCNPSTHSCGTPVANGSECGQEAPVGGIEASQYNCLNGRCTNAPMWCQCYTQANGGGCNCYELIGGRTSVNSSNSVACNGSNLDYRTNSQNMSRFCPGGCFRTNPPNLNGHFVCF